MNLSNFKVIPQSNVRKGEASLEELKPLFVPEVVKPDLVFDEEKEKFFITLKFIKEQVENQGFTAITDGISTYLIRTTEADINKDLHPKFFRGNKTQYATSDYLRLLTKDLGNDLFLHETKIEDYQAFLVSNDKTNPFYDVKNAGLDKTEDISDAVVSVKFSENLPVDLKIQTEVEIPIEISENISAIIEKYNEENAERQSDLIEKVENYLTATETTSTEDSFTYTSDLLDQPVENVENYM
jgi:hypothetical protein